MDIDEITAGYCDAALWADAVPLDMGNDGETGDMVHSHDIDPASRAKIKTRIEEWAGANHDQLALYAVLMADSCNGWTVWEQCGHDLRLTAGGHGAGFWDRGLPESLGDYLTAKAGAFGNIDCYESAPGTCKLDL